MNQELIDVMFKIIITVVMVLFTKYFIPYLQELIGVKKFDKLQEYIEYAVRCMEQTDKSNEEKKKYVYDYILAKTEEIGLKLEEKDVDLLVEGVVNIVKHGGE